MRLGFPADSARMHVMLMRTNGKALPHYWTHSLPARSLASPFSYYRAQVRKPKFHLAAFPHAPCLFAQTHPLSPFSPPCYLRRIVCGNACAIPVPLCKAKRIRSQIKSGRLTTRYGALGCRLCRRLAEPEQMQSMVAKTFVAYPRFGSLPRPKILRPGGQKVAEGQLVQ